MLVFIPCLDVLLFEIALYFLLIVKLYWKMSILNTSIVFVIQNSSLDTSRFAWLYPTLDEMQFL